MIDDMTYPADYSRPNPNGETDNLYLDMNGIVHPCSHPENRPPPATEDEMFLEIFKYTDRVVNMARPRKVLMIAVDGVAPRAKMNQQRSRRFKSAREAQLKDMQKKLAHEQMEAMGQIIDESIKKKSWDTNVITPGTPFMDKLAEAIRYWVAFKLNNEPGWENVCIFVLSFKEFILTHFAAQSNYIRCFSSRRRRTQDHGVHSQSTPIAIS